MKRPDVPKKLFCDPNTSYSVMLQRVSNAIEGLVNRTVWLEDVVQSIKDTTLKAKVESERDCVSCGRELIDGGCTMVGLCSVGNSYVKWIPRPKAKPQEPEVEKERLKQIIRDMIGEVGCRAGHTAGEIREHMEGLHKIFKGMFYGKPNEGIVLATVTVCEKCHRVSKCGKDTHYCPRCGEKLL